MPSIPSMKFEKLINEVTKKIKKKNNKIFKESGIWISLKRFRFFITKIDVIIWDENRSKDGKLNLSSRKPIIARGKHIKKIYWWEIKLYKEDNITNSNPPLVGFGEIWELLWLGISSEYLARNGIKILYEIKENIKLKENNKKFIVTFINY